MTLCVAAICSFDRHIALLADQKVSGEFVGDGIATKVRFVHPRWTVMYAGEMSVATQFLSRLELEHTKDLTSDKVSKHLTRVYQRIVEEFGAKDISATLEILAAGFDRKGAHLISIRSPGDAAFHRDAGFEAIGSGQYIAKGLLYFHSFNRMQPVELAVYRICEAKFFAERVVDIGERTSC